MVWRAVTVTVAEEGILGISPPRRAATIFNNGSATIYISQNAVNIATAGIPVIAGVAATLLAEDGDEPWLPLFAVAASGSQDVRIFESAGPANPPGAREEV